MITGELKSQVDKIWEAFWTGGISNPISVIEQFTYLLFIRRLDEEQLKEEKKAALVGIPMKKVLFTEAQKPPSPHHRQVDPQPTHHRIRVGGTGANPFHRGRCRIAGTASAGVRRSATGQVCP